MTNKHDVPRRTVYVCKTCDVLLIKVNGTITRRYGFCATLEGAGAYNDDDEAEEIDVLEVFSCPTCDEEVKEEDAFLVPVTAIPKLIELWKKIDTEISDESIYGIPLTDDRLAEVMTEHLL